MCITAQNNKMSYGALLPHRAVVCWIAPVLAHSSLSPHHCHRVLILRSKQHQRGYCGLFVLLLIPPP